ncbi:GTP 3',8-cyclase MoaA [Congregicoccus parvus]|uniref:GTP 3',8-cyclase MoaA n=1 Tax=Congregicoccus parvus TaxID=3081749 RepID=UPI003FA61498
MRSKKDSETRRRQPNQHTQATPRPVGPAWLTPPENAIASHPLDDASTAAATHAPRDQYLRPLRDLRISVTDRCNFRCPYCMPREVFGPDYAFLPPAAVLSDDEIERLSRLFVRAGVEKLRITGGEPLMRPGLPELLGRLAAIDGVRDLSLTTNAWFLARLAPALAAAGLRRINVSLDALSPDVFARMNGRGLGPSRVLEGIDSALAAGLGVKVNMVVQRGVNEHEILPMARHFRALGITLRFIEYMDVGTTNGWRMEQVLPAREIVRLVASDHPLEPVAPAYRGEVAARYRYVGTATEIGIISSVTEPFCSACHRARLSADGKLFTCLFAAHGHDLRALVREHADDEFVFARLAAIWRARTDRYSDERSERLLAGEARPKVEMSFIGG